MADATPKPIVQTFSPWVFVNEGLREPLARALAAYQPEGNADPVQVASVTTDAIAQLNSLAAEFNAARVQIECQCNSASKQSTIIIQGRKFLS